jgi:hypothetical protein
MRSLLVRVEQVELVVHSWLEELALILFLAQLHRLVVVVEALLKEHPLATEATAVQVVELVGATMHLELEQLTKVSLAVIMQLTSTAVAVVVLAKLATLTALDKVEMVLAQALLAQL